MRIASWESCRRRFSTPTGSDLPFDAASTYRTDLWIPLSFTLKEASDRSDPNYYAVARLKPGVSIAQAQADMALIMQRLDRLHSVDVVGNGSTHGWGALVESVRDTAVGPVRSLLWLLLGAVCCVLMIACGNTANLLLARAPPDRTSWGVRAALGAGRICVIRQLLTESLLLSSIAGAAGIALAWIFLRLLLRLDPGDIPRLQQASLNAWVLLFVIGLVLTTCMLFGALPAISSSRIDLTTSLKSIGTRGIVAPRDRGRNLLVTGEIVLVTVLLSGAGLLVRSYIKLTAVQPGFASSTITFDVKLDSRYAGRELGQIFFHRLLEKIEHIPGVQSAGAACIDVAVQQLSQHDHYLGGRLPRQQQGSADRRRWNLCWILLHDENDSDRRPFLHRCGARWQPRRNGQSKFRS